MAQAPRHKSVIQELRPIIDEFGVDARPDPKAARERLEFVDSVLRNKDFDPPQPLPLRKPAPIARVALGNRSIRHCAILAVCRHTVKLSGFPKSARNSEESSTHHHVHMPQDDLIRFVTNNRHPPYGHRSGVLQAAYALWRNHGLPKSDHEELRALLDWFNERLDKPERFSASRRPHAKGTAISWIRASAHEHLARLRRLVALVETAGVSVEELRTKRPGYVLYEDDQQVVALPFADTPS